MLTGIYNQMLNKESKMCTIGLIMITIMILHHSKLHMPEICGKICRIYAAHMYRIFRQIPHIFPHILPQKVLHILRKFSAINRHP